MSVARSSVLALALPALITMSTGCASNSISTTPATFPQATVPSSMTSPATAAITAATTATGIISGAQSVGCDTDLGTMETAVESFFALNGRYPYSEAELVLSGVLVGQSVFHDVGPDGAVVPSGSGGCLR